MSRKQSPEAKRRSKRYGRLLSALFFGSWFFIAGLIGYDLNTLAAVRWRPTPVLSEVAIGGVLLLLAVYWYRHLDDPRLAARRPAPPKIVGRGKSAGAERSQRLRQPSEPGEHSTRM
jgi:hypothetical protein